jgi:hypothetical protein
VFIGISIATKTVIIELIEAGVNKPNAILRNLKAKGHKEPSKVQLSNFLATHRKEKCPAILSLGSLEHLCNNLSNESDNIDEPFVVHSSFNYDSKRFGVRNRNRVTVRDDFLNIAVIFSSVNVFGFFLEPNTNLDQN